MNIYNIVDRPMAPNCSSATSALSTISSSRNQGYIFHKSEAVLCNKLLGGMGMSPGEQIKGKKGKGGIRTMNRVKRP